MTPVTLHGWFKGMLNTVFMHVGCPFVSEREQIQFGTLPDQGLRIVIPLKSRKHQLRLNLDVGVCRGIIEALSGVQGSKEQPDPLSKTEKRALLLLFQQLAGDLQPVPVSFPSNVWSVYNITTEFFSGKAGLSLAEAGAVSIVPPKGGSSPDLLETLLQQRLKQSQLANVVFALAAACSNEEMVEFVSNESPLVAAQLLSAIHPVRASGIFKQLPDERIERVCSGLGVRPLRSALLLEALVLELSAFVKDADRRQSA